MAVWVSSLIVPTLNYSSQGYQLLLHRRGDSHCEHSEPLSWSACIAKGLSIRGGEQRHSHTPEPARGGKNENMYISACVCVCVRVCVCVCVLIERNTKKLSMLYIVQ